MNGNPTATQKRFHQWCRDNGCVIDGTEHPAIHHIAGAKMKLKGVKSAGEWYCIPVSYYWHQDGTNPAAIHVNKAEFVEGFRMTEKEFWLVLMEQYKAEKGSYPMPEHEYEIIKERA